jgi:hypothetical protein
LSSLTERRKLTVGANVDIEAVDGGEGGHAGSGIAGDHFQLRRADSYGSPRGTWADQLDPLGVRLCVVARRHEAQARVCRLKDRDLLAFLLFHHAVDLVRQLLDGRVLHVAQGFRDSEGQLAEHDVAGLLRLESIFGAARGIESRELARAENLDHAGIVVGCRVLDVALPAPLFAAAHALPQPHQPELCGEAAVDDEDRIGPAVLDLRGEIGEFARRHAGEFVSVDELRVLRVAGGDRRLGRQHHLLVVVGGDRVGRVGRNLDDARRADLCANVGLEGRVGALALQEGFAVGKAPFHVGS